MTDRYEKIRQALAMGPTPGPWRPSKSYGAIVSDSPSGHDDAESVHAYGGHIVCESVQEHNRHLIAACDPDTIRELLAERDALAAKVKRLADALRLAEEHINALTPEWYNAGQRVLTEIRAALPKGNVAHLTAAQRPADDEVVFIDGVGAGRRSIKSCRDGVQWIRVGDRVYWPLSESDAKRLQSACCGNGSFDGPATPAGEGEQK